MNDPSKEIFSIHLTKVSPLKLFWLLTFKLNKADTPGLYHSEKLFATRLGKSVFSPFRYNIREYVLFAWWKDEQSLENYLNHSKDGILINKGWHARMQLYRRWGEIAELKDAYVHKKTVALDQPVIAITLARLKIINAVRFVYWGKPVEKQVKNHPGKTLALAAMRPFNHFATISIWRSENEMINMVHGKDRKRDGQSHVQAMAERNRKSFHYEFSTMRYKPIGEYGSRNGHSSFLTGT